MLVLAAAAAVAALAWVYLLACHGGFWRTGQRLPPGPVTASTGPVAWPAVTVVVPARDEAAVLPATLPTLLTQDYPGELRVILVDDDSADGTAQVAEKLAAASGQPFADRQRLVAAGPRPGGWAGKVWAMQCGLAAAGQPEYVLFTDADISYAPGTLTALVRAADGGGYGLVSQMALLRTETAWERLIVPAFVYFFAQLYPFRRVSKATSRTAAAAGGCMLVRRGALEKAGGLAMIRGARIDDVSLGRVLKRSGARCWLGLTTDVRSRRPYPSLAGLWDMVARSAYTQLRYSPLLLAGTLAGLAWLYLLPPAAAIAGLAAVAAGGGTAALATAAAGLAGWALLTASYVPMQRLYGLPAWRALALPFSAALYGAMTFDSARRHWAGRGGEWKGRTI
jgi:hopene-associated glycosyltransferase HpnB